MRLLQVSSEVFPFSRTGGLADVMAALPEALVRLGHEVTVVSPWWGALAGEPRIVWQGSVIDNGRLTPGPLRLGEILRGGVRYLFLGTPDFERPSLYGEDEVRLLTEWGRLLLPTLMSAGLVFDVLHGHDWGAALPVVQARLAGLRTVFTVHNLQYQGKWNISDGFGWTGLPEYAYSGVEYHGDLNLMKAALVYADRLTTVSPSYAQEITTPAYGEGLESVLQGRASRGELSGILNGLDLARWNPARDPDIKAFKTLKGRAANAGALRAEFGLDRAPVLSAVTRLASQKGLDLLVEALPEVTLDWNVVVLGSGDPLLEAALTGWSQHPRVRYVGGMNEGLAHRLYAGSDAFCMPSRFEPCGLSQMIAMRYGCLPVVRETGGLIDSVPPEVGFRFGPATATALSDSLKAAHAEFQQPALWQERMAKGMALDFSWDASARQYAVLYGALV